MNMGTPHPSRNQDKILKSHGIERVNYGFNPFTTEPPAIFLLLETDNLGVIH